MPGVPCILGMEGRGCISCDIMLYSTGKETMPPCVAVWDFGAMLSCVSTSSHRRSFEPMYRGWDLVHPPLNTNIRLLPFPHRQPPPPPLRLGGS